MLKTIGFKKELRCACPKLISGVIQCSVKNTLVNRQLWDEIGKVSEKIRKERVMGEVKNIATVQATRIAYKNCGKDPNRYRPSAEQLNRRILQGKDLYQISTLVDLVNLVSLKSGYSIGGFDATKIQGDLEYGIGEKDEVYNGIGRGRLNIEGLPVLRDAAGGIGTPTSDEERTMLSENTSHFLMNINAFDGDGPFLDQTIEWSVSLLRKWVEAQNIKVHKFE